MIYYSFRMTYVNDLINLNLFIYLSLPFIIIKVYFTRYTSKEWFWFCIIGFLFTLNTYYTRDTSLLITFVSFYGFKDVELLTTLKVYFYTKLSALLLTVMFAIFNVIPNDSIVNLRFEETVSRYSLGFVHPNQLAIVILTLLLIFFYIYKDHSNFYLHYFIWSIVVVSQFFITRSRTSFTIMLAFLLLIFVLNYTKKNIQLILKWFSLLSFPVLSAFTILLPKINNNSLMQFIDQALQNRLTLSKRYLNSISIDPLGKDILTVAENTFESFYNMNNYYILDSGILQLIYGAGYLGFIVFMIVYLIGIVKLINAKDYFALIIISFIVILGFVENTLMSIMFNFTVFIFANIILNNQEKAEESQEQIFNNSIGTNNFESN